MQCSLSLQPATSTHLKRYLPSHTSQSKLDISDAERGLDTSGYTVYQEDTSFIVNNTLACNIMSAVLP